MDEQIKPEEKVPETPEPEKASTKEAVRPPPSPPYSKWQEVTENINLDNPPVYVEGLKLNIGSGIDYKKGYINVDKYDNSADARWDIHDMPLHDNSVAQIVAYQVMEHLSKAYVTQVLKEFYRILKPQANFIMTIPDIISACQRVVNDPSDTWALAHIYGNQTHEGQFHKWGWTSVTMGGELAFAGFRRIKAFIYDSPLGIKEIWLEAIK